MQKAIEQAIWLAGLYDDKLDLLSAMEDDECATVQSEMQDIEDQLTGLVNGFGLGINVKQALSMGRSMELYKFFKSYRALMGFG